MARWFAERLDKHVDIRCSCRKLSGKYCIQFFIPLICRGLSQFFDEVSSNVVIYTAVTWQTDYESSSLPQGTSGADFR